MAQGNLIIEDMIIDLCEDDDKVFELLLESSSDSDSSSLDSLNARDDATRIENYLHVIDGYSDKEFVSHFRLTRATASYLIGCIERAEIMSTVKSGREKVTPQEGIYITLWYLSNTETYRQLSDRFNKTQSTIYTTITKVTHYFVTIAASCIKWPTEQNDIHEIVNGFYKKQKLNGVLGAIDGTHIKIRKPQTDQQAYCNRKSYHSILVQGVVDHNRRFIDAFCGEAGSMHDARLLKKSKLYEKIYSNEIKLGNNYLIGDAAYPNLPWLVTPFKDNGHLTQNQNQFNFKLSATRMVVEHAFGLLKGRFRRLRFFDNKNKHFIVECVMAAMVFHNIAINMKENVAEIVEIEDTANVNEDVILNDGEDFRRRDELFRSMFEL